MTTGDAQGVSPTKELDQEIVRFLRESPRSPILRIAQEVLPELFRQPHTERAITYAWLGTHLGRLSEQGVLRQERGEFNAQVWAA